MYLICISTTGNNKTKYIVEYEKLQVLSVKIGKSGIFRISKICVRPESNLHPQRFLRKGRVEARIQILGHKNRGHTF